MYIGCAPCDFWFQFERLTKTSQTNKSEPGKKGSKKL